MRNLLNFLRKYSYGLLFVVLEVISLVLLFRFNHYQGSVFFTSASAVAGTVCEASSKVTRYFGLVDANRNLTQRNVELELEVDQLKRALSHYSQDTTAWMHLREKVLSGYQVYEAHVINNSLTEKDNYMTIDKGSADGIRSEMGVVCGNGVIGIVYITGKHYSVILPVLNSKSSISCKIKRTSYFGFLKWEGGSTRYAWVKDLPRHSEFTLGDTIVTSGHSAVFPAGIPIGTVDDMQDSHDGLSYLLKAKLFTDFARVYDVCVISPPPHQAEQAVVEDSVKILTN